MKADAERYRESGEPLRKLLAEWARLSAAMSRVQQTLGTIADVGGDKEATRMEFGCR